MGLPNDGIYDQSYVNTTFIGKIFSLAISVTVSVYVSIYITNIQMHFNAFLCLSLMQINIDNEVLSLKRFNILK